MLKNRYLLFTTAVFATLIAAMWSISSGRLINFDGILYLRSAQALLEQDFSAAYAIYKWPLYASLIAVVKQLSGMSLIMAAYAVNTLLQIILTLSFISLVKQLGGNQRCQWFALIVLLANPYLNDYRSFIMRDFGYWAFLLLSMSILMTAVNKQRFLAALTAGVTLCVGALFRVEGIAFALLLPLTLLFANTLSRRKKITYLFAAILPVLVGLFAFVFIAHAFNQDNIRAVGRMDHVMNLASAFSTISDNVTTIIGQMKSTVLDYQSQRGASVIVIAGLLGLLLFEIIKVANPVLFLFAAYAAKRHFMPRTYGKRLCKSALLINLAILLYFVGTFAFLSGRYVIPLSLIFLLWAPFTIEHFYQYFCVCQRKNIKYWYYPITGIILTGFLVYNISHAHYDKEYIRNAGQWTERHVAESTELLSNSAEFLFYSRGIIKNWDDVYNTEVTNLLDNVKRKQVVALKLNKKQALKMLPTLTNWQMLATFKNEHGDCILLIQKDKKG